MRSRSPALQSGRWPQVDLAGTDIGFNQKDLVWAQLQARIRYDMKATWGTHTPRSAPGTRIGPAIGTLRAGQLFNCFASDRSLFTLTGSGSPA